MWIPSLKTTETTETETPIVSTNYLTLYKAKCYSILDCFGRLKGGAIFCKITL